MTNLVPRRPTGGNVLPFAPRGIPGPAQQRQATQTSDAFRALTRTLILAKAGRGELEPALVEYLLDAAGVA